MSMNPQNFYISPYNFLFITNSSSSSPPFHRLNFLPLNSIRPLVDRFQKEEVEWFLGPLLVLVDLGVKEEVTLLQLKLGDAIRTVVDQGLQRAKVGWVEEETHHY